MNICGTGGVDPLSLNLDSRHRSVVGFMSGRSAIDVRRVAGSVDARVSLNDLEVRECFGSVRC